MAHRPVHRNNDRRDCNASTRARSRSVRVNSRWISIQGDPNSHRGGALKATITPGKVHAENRAVILIRDPASSDSLCGVIGHGGHGHCNPRAATASPDVRAGNGS